jgi:eukaryotic-like serine/threonine-protein kinase
MAEHLGPYELVRLISKGGMGQVHLARHLGPESFEKLVVLKTLRPEHAVDPQFRAMFLDEARLAARLIHPNVIHIFDFGEVGDTYYIAMEYLPGVDAASLRLELARRRRSLPVAIACRIVIDAALGLHYAHELRGEDGKPLGLVHRDVSPQNILVGYEGAVKLIDFGIAKAAGRLTQTQTGVLKGKFAYMSPEQAAGETIDRRSDVFALGVVFHELLTGGRLFDRDTETEVLRAVQDGAIEPPSKLNPECPSALDAVLLKALARNRGDRYATAHELLSAVEAFLVENRIPASQAHLAAFLQEIFPEHRDATPSNFPDTVIARNKEGDGTVGPTTISVARRRRSALLAAIGTAVVAILGTATFLMTKRTASRQLTDTQIHLTTGSPASLAPEPSSPLEAENPASPPAVVDIPIESEPPQATVIINGQVIGSTPTTWHVSPSEVPVSITFKLRGFRDKTVIEKPRAGLVVKASLYFGAPETPP